MTFAAAPEAAPAVVGEAFERAVNESPRHHIGAHYTRRADVETLILPVVMAPLSREWAAAQGEGADAVARFRDRLAAVTVLDPSCGGGNFLMVTLYHLLDLEREVMAYQREHFGHAAPARVCPHLMRGIEIDPCSAELARFTIWLAYLQWTHAADAQPA